MWLVIVRNCGECVQGVSKARLIPSAPATGSLQVYVTMMTLLSRTRRTLAPIPGVVMRSGWIIVIIPPVL